MLALADADIAKLTGAGKVLAVLVERYSHDPVGRVKSLLDTITVMDIDVDIEDALVEAQQFEDAQNNV